MLYDKEKKEKRRKLTKQDIEKEIERIKNDYYACKSVGVIDKEGRWLGFMSACSEPVYRIYFSRSERTWKKDFQHSCIEKLDKILKEKIATYKTINKKAFSNYVPICIRLIDKEQAMEQGYV